MSNAKENKIAVMKYIIAVLRKMRYVVALQRSLFKWLYKLSVIPHLFEKGYISFLILIFCCSIALPAAASVCRNYEGKQICIVDIKRSAKNYWEYRAIVSVDRVKMPVETYNCRSRSRVKKDGTILQFTANDPGNLICSFFKQK